MSTTTVNKSDSTELNVTSPDVELNELELQQMLAELQTQSSEYLQAFEPAIYSFIRITEEKYASELDRFLQVYRSDKRLGLLLEPLLLPLREYLWWMRWVGWNISNLGPALHEDARIPAERLALAMLAYVAGRLVDDGLDRHLHYKGQRKTLVAIVADQLPASPAHTSCVQSVFIGFCLFNYALKRMHESGQQQSAHVVRQLFEVSSVGVMAEYYVGSEISEDLYRQIIGRKAVAYNMILYKPFLEGTEGKLRLELLKILARFDELAQIVNDYNDVEDDRTTGQMNAFTHGVFDAAALQSEIAFCTRQMLTATARWPDLLKGGLATMLKHAGIIALLKKRAASAEVLGVAT